MAAAAAPSYVQEKVSPLEARVSNMLQPEQHKSSFVSVRVVIVPRENEEDEAATENPESGCDARTLRIRPVALSVALGSAGPVDRRRRPCSHLHRAGESSSKYDLFTSSLAVMATVK
ncbi:hypothetical protein NHX12_013846, partial [Muraenolepis orangiensis]